MPALVAFGHKWGIGSDDLAIPSALEAAASAAWLVSYGRVLYQKSHVLSSTLEGVTVKYVLIGGAFLNAFNLLVLGYLIHTSFKGSVINDGQRKRVGPLLGAKLLYEGATICFGLNSVHLLHYNNWLVPASDAYKTLRSATRAHWGVTLVSSIVLWHILNPFRRKVHHGKVDAMTEDLEHSTSVQEVITDKWTQRFLYLGKFLGIEGHPALNKVGQLFSDIFQGESDLDLVATDVIAALMIIEKEQTHKFERIARNSPTLDFPRQRSPSPQVWMNVPEAAHYMKYAAGCYGWPMYIWSSPFASWALFRVIARSRYFPRQLPDNVINDNILMANTTVIKMVTGLPTDDLVYVSFHNKLFEVPFYVALDRDQQAVVVAIRGTLSMEDILTDLSAYEAKEIKLPGVSGATAHEGMYYAAEYLQRKLLGLDTRGKHVEQGLLERALQAVEEGKAKDYKLVIVGHSLGAGVAGILGLLMHQHEYYGPQLECFAYSPPGGLLSLPAAEYAEKCVCSVVLGDDLVPRIGLINLFKLKTQVLCMIQSLDQPKHEIFQGWFRNLLSSVLGVAEPDIKHRPHHSWTGNTEEQMHVLAFQRSLQVAIENGRKQMAVREKMCLPGCVLFIQENEDINSEEKFTSNFVCPDSYLFSEIIFSKTLISDHTPWAVLSALTQLSQVELKKDQ